MRLLHLSDLHIGKQVNEFSLLEDQALMLETVVGIVEQRDVDAVIIAGDVYDRRAERRRRRLFRQVPFVSRRYGRRVLHHPRQPRLGGTYRLRRASTREKPRPHCPRLRRDRRLSHADRRIRRNDLLALPLHQAGERQAVLPRRRHPRLHRRHAARHRSLRYRPDAAQRGDRAPVRHL